MLKTACPYEPTILSRGRQRVSGSRASQPEPPYVSVGDDVCAVVGASVGVGHLLGVARRPPGPSRGKSNRHNGRVTENVRGAAHGPTMKLTCRCQPHATYPVAGRRARAPLEQEETLGYAKSGRLCNLSLEPDPALRDEAIRAWWRTAAARRRAGAARAVPGSRARVEEKVRT